MVSVQFACCDSESCQPVKMWSWRSLILYIALGIFLGPMKQVSGQDGFLRCDDKWISGIDVTLRCEVSKASIDTKCDTQQNSTFFKKDDVNQCSVLDNEYANCLPEGSQSEPTSSCWCEQNDTYFIFMHKFKADRFISEGVWTCQKVCFDSGGFNNPLIMSEDSSCDSSVEVSECDKKTCNPPSSCELDRERNKASCVCPFGYFGENCDLIEELVIIIALGCVLLVAVVIFFIVVIFRLLWKKLFSCVICVIVCVDNETKKKTLHTDSTKRKVENFVSEHFTMHCCCCCCCSWLGWCCLGRLKWRGKKGDGNDGGVEGGALASSEGCIMGCVWCLSSVQNVKVDVHDIEDNQVSVLITLTSPLSWYSEAEDMPEKVKEYIRTKILKEPAKELRHTSKPSMHLGVGAGSPDRRNEPPADYPAGPPQAKTEYTGNGNGSGR